MFGLISMSSGAVRTQTTESSAGCARKTKERKRSENSILKLLISDGTIVRDYALKLEN